MVRLLGALLVLQATVKSFTSGAVDLKKEPLKVTSSAPPAPIQITLEYSPPKR